MKTQLLKDWVEALEIASLYLRARQGAERDETKEIKKGKRETYDFEILLINMIFFEIYIFLGAQREKGWFYFPRNICACPCSACCGFCSLLWGEY
jgi:hypothetical protein